MPRALAIMLALALAVTPAPPLAAQEAPEPREQGDEEPVQEQPAPAAAPATPPPPVPSFSVSLTFGAMGDRPLQGQPVLAERRDAAGNVLQSASLGRSLEAEGGFEVGISGLMTLDPAWAVRLGAGIGRTTFGVSYNGEDDVFVAAAGHLAAGEATPVTIVVLEGALRLRIPSTRQAQPYLELGATSIRWHADSPLSGADGIEDGVHRLAGTAAVGVEIPLRDRLSARLHASARTYRTPLDVTSAGTESASSPTLSVTFADPAATLFADAAQELTTAFRLDLGLTLAFGTRGP